MAILSLLILLCVGVFVFVCVNRRRNTYYKDFIRRRAHRATENSKKKREV